MRMVTAIVYTMLCISMSTPLPHRIRTLQGLVSFHCAIRKSVARNDLEIVTILPLNLCGGSDYKFLAYCEYIFLCIGIVTIYPVYGWPEPEAETTGLVRKLLT